MRGSKGTPFMNFMEQLLTGYLTSKMIDIFRNKRLSDIDKVDKYLGFGSPGKLYLPNANLSKLGLYRKSLYSDMVLYYHGWHLSHADLSNSTINEAYLREVDLYNANLSNSNLSNSDFSNSDFRLTNFSGCKIANCDFNNSKLKEANLSNVRV